MKCSKRFYQWNIKMGKGLIIWTSRKVRWICTHYLNIFRGKLQPANYESGQELVLNLTFSSVQFSCSVASDSLQPHISQHARPPCPSSTPGIHSDICPSSRWCHQAISSSVVPFSSCPQSLPTSGSFPMSQLFASGGQSIGVSTSASVLPKNTQDWSP